MNKRLPKIACLCLILPLAGCDDWSDVVSIIEGRPTKAQVAHETAVALHVSAPVEVAMPAEIAEPEIVVAAIEPEPTPKPECVDLGWRWGYCDPMSGEWVAY